MAEEDLIYGKKRHMFGGIEPSNMKRFEVSVADGNMIITAQLPDDTVVNGQTLCTVEGAIIREGFGGFPKDEFDGTLIEDIKSSTTFVYAGDTTITRYFAAFPYTTQGVYNRNPKNRTTLNVPTTVEKYDVKTVFDHNTYEVDVELDIIGPEDVDTVSVYRSLTDYPDTSGVLVGTLTSSGRIIDKGANAGQTRYYSVFSHHGSVINSYAPAKIKVYCPRYNYLFGFDIDLDDPDPVTRVTYPDDVMNTDYKPAHMNWDLKK